MLNSNSQPAFRRDGRVAEGARLESVFRGNSNLGSNPSLSAIYFIFNNLDQKIDFRFSTALC